MGSPTGLVRRVLPQVAVLVASVLVVVLAVKNRELRAGYQDFYDTVRFPHPGAYVPIFKAVTLAGDSSTIGIRPDSTYSQLIFFFNTDCEFCRRSVPAWNRIYARLRTADSTEVVGVSLDSAHVAEIYAHDHDVRFPVIPLLDRRIAELYRVRAVPLTVLLTGGGRVFYARRGVLETDVQVDSVLLAVRLLASQAAADMLAPAPGASQEEELHRDGIQKYEQQE